MPFLTVLRLPPSEQLAAMRVLAVALVVEVAVRVVKLPRLAALLGITPVWAPGVAPSLQSIADFDPPLRRKEVRHVRSVIRIMRHWPFGRGACLRQSLVLGHLLRHRRPLLRIGVRVDSGAVTAHAWVEVSGLAIDDQGFTPLLHLPTRPDTVQ